MTELVPVNVTVLEAQRRLKELVRNATPSPHSRRAYEKALDNLFLFAGGRPLTRALLMEWRSSMEGLSPATVNVRLSAVRKMVTEAKRNGMLGADDAGSLLEVPNLRQRGTRMGNWLTREQAKELLAVPDRSTLKGKRDYCILAVLVGCALRRRELAELDIDKIQLREGRWVIADLRGKGGRVRTVALPIWVKQAVNAWQIASHQEEGPLLGVSDFTVWKVVSAAARAIGIEHLGAHDLRRTCAKLCRKAGGDLEQIKFLLGHSSIQTTERYLGSEQEIAVAVNDSLGL